MTSKRKLFTAQSFLLFLPISGNSGCCYSHSSEFHQLDGSRRRHSLLRTSGNQFRLFFQHHSGDFDRMGNELHRTIDGKNYTGVYQEVLEADADSAGFHADCLFDSWTAWLDYRQCSSAMLHRVQLVWLSH